MALADSAAGEQRLEGQGEAHPIPPTPAGPPQAAPDRRAPLAETDAVADVPAVLAVAAPPGSASGARQPDAGSESRFPPGLLMALVGCGVVAAVWILGAGAGSVYRALYTVAAVALAAGLCCVALAALPAAIARRRMWAARRRGAAGTRLQDRRF